MQCRFKRLHGLHRSGTQGLERPCHGRCEERAGKRPPHPDRKGHGTKKGFRQPRRKIKQKIPVGRIKLMLILPMGIYNYNSPKRVRNIFSSKMRPIPFLFVTLYKLILHEKPRFHIPHAPVVRIVPFVLYPARTGLLGHAPSVCLFASLKRNHFPSSRPRRHDMDWHNPWCSTL